MAITEETLLRYCQQIYDNLLEEAEPSEDHNFPVWSGGIVSFFSGQGISNAHYGTVLNALYESGSVVQLRRGARSTPTLLGIVRRPDSVAVPSPRLTKGGASDRLTDRVSELERRLQGVDVKKFIASTHTRLTALEKGKGE